jgi:hypothetical protein
MKPYANHPFALLSDSELEEISAYDFPIPEDAENRIQARFASKTRRERKGKMRGAAVVACIAVVMLTLVSFASSESSNRIVQLYRQYFGMTAELTQYAADTIATTEDRGITVKSVSTINDGNKLYMFVDMIYSGDSTEPMDVLDAQLDFADSGKADSMDARRLLHDRSSNTTTYLFEFGLRENEKEATLHINTISIDEQELSGTWEISFPVPDQMPTYDVTLEEPIPYGDGTARVLPFTVSPLGVKIATRSTDTDTLIDLTIAAIYRDGSREVLQKIREITTTSISIADHDIFAGPILNFDNLQAIEINGVIVELAID